MSRQGPRWATLARSRVGARTRGSPVPVAAADGANTHSPSSRGILAAGFQEGFPQRPPDPRQLQRRRGPGAAKRTPRTWRGPCPLVPEPACSPRGLVEGVGRLPWLLGPGGRRPSPAERCVPGRQQGPVSRGSPMELPVVLRAARM
ncbi:unnamed protein product [Caretta caretta]